MSKPIAEVYQMRSLQILCDGMLQAGMPFQTTIVLNDMKNKAYEDTSNSVFQFKMELSQHYIIMNVASVSHSHTSTQ